MRTVILILSLSIGATAFGYENGVFVYPENCARSKNPRCWKPQHFGGIIGQPHLRCAADGSATVGGYIGEGPGCGEGPSLVLESQSTESVTATTHISTGTRHGTFDAEFACHYWGRIHDEVFLDLPTGTWTVIVDGFNAGRVLIDRNQSLCEIQ